MLLLSELPQDLLKKVLKKYLKGCDGTPAIWRLVCRELRAVAADEPHVSCLQFMGVSLKLVRMMREWIRDGVRAECRKSPPPMKDCRSSRVWESDLLTAVVKYNNAAVLEEALKDGWTGRTGLLSRGERKTNALCCAAASAGALDSFKVLMRHGLHMDALTCQHAVERGHVDVVAWHMQVDGAYFVLKANVEGRHPYHFRHPVAGFAPCSMDLCAQHTPLQVYGDLLEKAVQCGHLQVAKLLLPRARKSEGADLLSSIASLAAEHGRLEILKWAAAEMGDRFPLCVERVLCKAEIAGQLEILKWLYQLGYQIDFEHAYRDNAWNLELVQWLVEEAGMELTYATMCTAMFSNCNRQDSAVMDYLHSKQCPRMHSSPPDDNYDDEYQYASELGVRRAHWLMQWLYDHDYPLPVERGAEAMSEAMKADVADVVAGLHFLGIPFDPEWYAGVNYYKGTGWGPKNWKNREVIVWARDNGYDVPSYPTDTDDDPDDDDDDDSHATA